jgi:glycosyltransferase involved in cell wall biosynthesis
VLLADGLRDRGHTVETWFFYRKRTAFEGSPALRVLFASRPSPVDMAQLPIKLVAMLRDFAPQALITHTHYANVVAQPAARIAAIPARIAVQQNPVDSYPRLAKHADRMLGTGSTYSHIVCVSHSVAASARHYPPAYRAKLSVIHNAASHLSADVAGGAALAHYGLPENVPLLVNVGRLHYQKNQATLIRAMAHVPSAHLVIAGEGELRRELAALAISLGVESRVHLLGEIPWEQTVGISRHARAFVFPSLFEGMSLALVEAMTLGLPVVASDIPSAREALSDSGLFVPASDPVALSKAITLVLSDQEVDQRLRSLSLERAQLFSLQKMTDAYESMVAGVDSHYTSPYHQVAHFT